jgi:flagellar motor switch protein FliM
MALNPGCPPGDCLNCSHFINGICDVTSVQVLSLHPQTGNVIVTLPQSLLCPIINRLSLEFQT